MRTGSRMWVNVRRVENGIRMLKNRTEEPTNRRPVSGIETQKPKPLALSDIEADDEPRINMHDDELNRVIGRRTCTGFSCPDRRRAGNR